MHLYVKLLRTNIIPELLAKPADWTCTERTAKPSV
jgi:hypothetical protein